MQAFCPACGEKRLDEEDLRTRVLVSQFLGGFFNLDNKFWRTLISLATKPGLLTAEARRGRRNRYMRPVQLFLLCNLLYFWLQPFTGANTLANSMQSHLERQPHSEFALARVQQRLEETQESQATYIPRFQDKLDSTSRTMVFVLLPLFALLLIGVCLPRRPPLAILLHLSVEFVCFLLVVCFLLWFVALRLFVTYVTALPDAIRNEAFLTTAGMLLPVGMWLTFALKRNFDFSTLQAALRGAAFAALTLFPILAFRFLTFLYCLYTV